MRILCLGAGAIGAYFGGRLQESGADVTFLVRARRQKQIEEHGLRIESQFGNYAGAAKTALQAADVGPCDLVLLTCKAYDLPSSIEAITPAVNERTAILPLLNGVAHIKTLNQTFGRDRVLGGVAKIAATLSPDGVIRHLNDWRYITFGEQDGSLSSRVQELREAFDERTVIASATTDIMQTMWEKLVHLSTVAGMTCLMRASIGEVARTASGAQIMLRFLAANAHISKAEGYPPSDDFMAEYTSLLRDRQLKYTASMLRDIEAGNRTEADHIIGFMLGRARQHGHDVTLHELVYTHLQAYEERRAAGRL